MNELYDFESEEFGNVRIVTVDNEPIVVITAYMNFQNSHNLYRKQLGSQANWNNGQWMKITTKM